MTNKNNMKITRISAVTQVCEHLKKGIISGVWSSGSKLPSESDLALMHGVNRLTVRMALQTLSTLGVVETRSGDGTYVQDFSISKVFHSVSDFYYDIKPFKEIQDLRILIEVECCRLAISNATEEDLKELKLHLDRFLAAKDDYQKNCNEETLNHLVEEDLLFHYQICQISHNSVYADVFYLTRNIIRQYLMEIISKKTTSFLEKKYSEDLDSHTTIYESLKAKDFYACKTAYLRTITLENS